jgi:2-polyprenyl-6-methoxyphenol hydroxylase-like FAD-dependent oxidoreductase
MLDAVVIGAGPAGSLAALLLARGGWDVCLVEQHPVPRDKVCGECLSALGLDVLRRTGLLDTLRADGPTSLTRAALHAPTGESATLDLASEMWGLSRARLDLRLLESARAAGIRILQPARCERILPGAPPRVVVREAATNHQLILEPRVVLLADGKGALLPERPLPTGDFGIKAHFTDIAAPPNTIGLFGVHGHYGGVCPIESNRCNAAFSIPAAALQATRGDLDRLFATIVNQNPELRRQFQNAHRITPWCTSPLPRFPVSPRWPDGVIPLGNAAAALEPIGGEGMGLALRSAELAAHTLLNSSTSDLRASFHHLWQLRRLACRTAARFLSSPTLSGPTVDWLQSNEQLGTLALRLMGKPAFS